MGVLPELMGLLSKDHALGLVNRTETNCTKNNKDPIPHQEGDAQGPAEVAATHS